MLRPEIDKLRKTAELILAAAAETGYYTETTDQFPDALIRLRVLPAYFETPPSPKEVKPIAQVLRTGLIRRGYVVKGIKPVRIQDGIVFSYVVRKPDQEE